MISDREVIPTHAAKSSSSDLALFAVGGIQEKEYGRLTTLICHAKGSLELEDEVILEYQVILKYY